MDVEDQPASGQLAALTGFAGLSWVGQRRLILIGRIWKTPPSCARMAL